LSPYISSYKKASLAIISEAKFLAKSMNQLPLVLLTKLTSLASGSMTFARDS
jgi:hypothetical protein